MTQRDEGIDEKNSDIQSEKPKFLIIEEEARGDFITHHKKHRSQDEK